MKKKILFSLLLLFSMLVVNAKSTESVYVYGVDYSSVKVYGAEETEEQFKNAFEGINLLLMNEAKKYDFTDIVGENNKLKLEMILNSTKECDFSNIKTLDKDIEPINIAEKIKNYPIKETSGEGFIVIATLLDKSSNKAGWRCRPAKNRMKRLKEKIKTVLCRRKAIARPLEDTITKLNQIIIGWK